MERLIDANKMIKELGISDRDIYCKCLIEEQPTTFDIEAIVKELEELRKITDVPMIHSYCNATITKAIEIVRRGGVNHA